MTQFRPIGDALKYVFLNTPRSPNLAATPRSLASRHLPLSIAFLKDSLSSDKDHCFLTSWEGHRLKAVSSARMKGGPRVWEVDRLHVLGIDGEHYRSPLDTDKGLKHDTESPSPADVESSVVEILEGLIRHASGLGAERLLLRLPYGSSVIPLAGRAGFFPCYTETLLYGTGGIKLYHQAQAQAQASKLRPQMSHEEYAVFQLYSASTPSSVRWSMAMTFDQWKDSRDPRGKGVIEEVHETAGKILATLVSDLGSRPARIEALVHPDAPELLPDLLGSSLARHGDTMWLVPEFQDLLKRLLVYWGFGEVGHYTVLVRNMATKVKQPILSPVEARVW